MSTVTDGNYLYIIDSICPLPDYQVAAPALNHLYCYDFSGNEIFSKNMPEFYMPDDPSPQTSKNCSMLNIAPCEYEKSLFLGTMCCCMHEFIDTTALIDGTAEDEADYLRWRNGQGDFFFDVYWQKDAKYPWACLTNAEVESHRIETVQVDSNGFNFIWATYIGSFSHGVSTQDGTSLMGAGLMAYADDALNSASDPFMGGGIIVDNGSQYDGMYVNAAPPVTLTTHEVYFVANDSAHGIITGYDIPITVEDEPVTAFEVSQNSPNPFNPATTISFTLPVSSDVSVEVFNIAGQKIATLADDFMNAGRHSVVWDASGFSNGVYFYTVRAGEYAKTMKMTLVK